MIMHIGGTTFSSSEASLLQVHLEYCLILLD
jgi:hypothetical protein